MHGQRNIFIASSHEAVNELKRVRRVLSKIGLNPAPWTSPELFPLAETTIESLSEATKWMQGAVFIFRPDDTRWYRVSGKRKQEKRTRDNVVLEFGLFAGALGRAACAICREDNAKVPSDLAGVTLLEFSDPQFEAKLGIWGNRLPRPPDQYSFLNPLEIKVILGSLRDAGVSIARCETIFERLQFPREQLLPYLEELSRGPAPTKSTKSVLKKRF